MTSKSLTSNDGWLRAVTCPSTAEPGFPDAVVSEEDFDTSFYLQTVTTKDRKSVV